MPQFRCQVERMRSGDGAALQPRPQSPTESPDVERQLRAELASQRALVKRLRSQADAAAEAAEEQARTAAEAERDWQVELARRSEEVASLQTALSARPSPAEVCLEHPVPDTTSISHFQMIH